MAVKRRNDNNNKRRKVDNGSQGDRRVANRKNDFKKDDLIKERPNNQERAQ
jgi:hypothetical protein